MANLRFLSTLFIICNAFITIASHTYPSNISYLELPNNQLEVTLHRIVECGGIGSPLSINYQIKECGISTSYTANKIGTGTLIPVFHDSVSLAIGSCNGGPVYEYLNVTYKDTITLNTNCNSFQVMWTEASGPIQNFTQTTTLMYIESSSYIPSNQSPVNSGPSVHAYNMNHNQPQLINTGIYDLDGDSLHFELVAIPISPVSSLAPVLPGTSTTPYPNFTIDSNTGQILYLPISSHLIMGLTVKVSEYDFGGILKGVSYHNYFVIQYPGNNSTDIEPNLNAITNLTNATFNNGIINCLPNQNNLCFDLIISDSNITDSIFLETNINNALPGAVTNIIGINPVTLNVCWNYANVHGQFYKFSTTARDNSLLDSIHNTPLGLEFLINLNNQPPKIITNNDTLCLGDSIQLFTNKGDNKLWTVISGPALVLGSNFSCDTCAHPIANPSATTTYQYAAYSGSVLHYDTIVIRVEQPSTIPLIDSMYTVCPNDSIQFQFPAVNYTAKWAISSGDSILLGTNFECDTCTNTWYITNNTPTLLTYSIDLNRACEQNFHTSIHSHTVANNAFNQTQYQSCQNDTLWLPSNPIGPTTFNGISGPLPVSGVSIGCDSCVSTWISLPDSAIWLATTIDQNSCSISDTLTFNVQTLKYDLGLPSLETLCMDDTITLFTTAQHTVNWESLYGNPLVVGQNISCLTCSDPEVYVTSDNILVVTNTYFPGCTDSDFVRINVNDTGIVLGTLLGQENGNSPYPLTNSLVQLLYWSNNSWLVQDSTYTNTYGQYSFNSTHDSISIKVTPSASFNNQSVWYYDNASSLSYVSGVSLDHCGITNLSGVIDMSITGLTINTIQRSIDLYPNPTQSGFTISSDHLKSQDFSIYIYDITGKLTFQLENLQANNNGTYTIEGLHLLDGMYLVDIKSNTFHSSKRLIVSERR